MPPDQTGTYHLGETTGFQSPARDYLEGVVNLAETLDLGAPGVYAVRVEGSALGSRGILNDDVLIVNTAGTLAAGGVAVVFLRDCVVLATVEYQSEAWWVRLQGRGNLVPVSVDLEIWGMVTGLVRTRM